MAVAKKVASKAKKPATPKLYYLGISDEYDGNYWTGPYTKDVAIREARIHTGPVKLFKLEANLIHAQKLDDSVETIEI